MILLLGAMVFARAFALPSFVEIPYTLQVETIGCTTFPEQAFQQGYFPEAVNFVTDQPTTNGILISDYDINVPITDWLTQNEYSSTLNVARSLGCQIRSYRISSNPNKKISYAANVFAEAYVMISLCMLVIVWIRLRPYRPQPASWQELLLFVALGIGVGLLVLALTQEFLSSIDPAYANLWVRALSEPNMKWILLVVGVFIAPFVEELWFRRFWLERFARAKQPILGAVFVSVMFASMHIAGQPLSTLNIMVTFAGSLLLCGVYLHSRSWRNCVALHSAYNATLLVPLWI